MKEWLRGLHARMAGRPAGLLTFLTISALVVGGLGWVTAAALRLEQEQSAERTQAEYDARLRLAMWRLESRVTPLVAREQSRPFDHYSTIYAPTLVFNNRGTCMQAGSVLELTPLLSAELPDWMLLHFQINSKGWESPQAPSDRLVNRLSDPRLRQLLRAAHGGDHQSAEEKERQKTTLPNLTPERRALLGSLARTMPPTGILELARARSEPATLRDTTLVVTGGNSVMGNTSNPVPSPQQLQQRAQQMPSSAQSAPGQGNEGQNEINLSQRQGNIFPNQMPNIQKPEGQGQLPLTTANADFNSRAAYQSKVSQEVVNAKEVSRRLPRDQVNAYASGNGADWLTVGKAPPKELVKEPIRKEQGPASTEAEVVFSSMVPLWSQTTGGAEQLLMLRLVRMEDQEICQGIVLDAAGLKKMLLLEVEELFPGADLVPERATPPEDLNHTMTSLPFKLDTGPAPAPANPGWTPLRVGLSLAWAAAGVALLAVYLGGWSLMDLSERRIRFVSAVTHELRTPLTTLRLYLDMLVGGLVRDEKQREEYLQTLNAEADRLNRLVGNVLDFSRLEKQCPQLNWTQAAVGELVGQAQSTWQGRCHDAGKDLLVENQLPTETALRTDPALVQQVLANLLDNACKYSRGADDPRLWFSRVREEKGRVVFEVEDRGPGVPTAERRSIFLAFRRGRCADVTAGGVGLGLALAHRWARLLGGLLVLRDDGAEGGICFQLWLPR